LVLSYTLGEWSESLNYTPVDELDSNDLLKQKLIYSLSCAKGKKGGDSFTVAELKSVCEERGVGASGSRKELIRRLLEL